MKESRKSVKLNSDQLGEKGEARFKEICADAKLICNQCDRDRTGWDFLVEFPFETDTDAIAPLENRQVPLSCHIQLKTILDKNNDFKMLLSSAERLAKELKPSFIYVFKVNDALEFTGAYLIHLWGEPLSIILKRLRKEDAAGHSRPNQEVISMSAKRYGNLLLPTGAAFRDALASVCGSDLHTYVINKKQQLEEVGFRERPYDLTMTLPGTLDDFVDVVLGIKQSARALNLTSSQTRFGIKLPIFKDQIGDISFTPTPADTCTITVRSRDLLSPPAVFQGEVFFPSIPGLPREHKKFRFKTDFFDLIVKEGHIEITSRPLTASQTPATWTSYFRLCFVLATGSGTFQVSSNSRSINTSFNLPFKLAEVNPEECRYAISVCEKLSSLLKHLGITEEPKFALETIHENDDRIITAYALIHREEEPTTFSLDSEDLEQLPPTLSLDVLYADFLSLNGITIGYYGIMSVAGKRADARYHWTADDIVLKEIVQLRSLPHDYEQLIEHAKKETGIENAFSRPFDQK